VGVMPHQGVWESHTQGEAVQVDGLARGSARDVRRLNWRKTVAGEPCDAETVMHGSERDGGKRASDGTSPAVYSTSRRRSRHSSQRRRRNAWDRTKGGRYRKRVKEKKGA
jgi:hypothetical protein